MNTQLTATLLAILASSPIASVLAAEDESVGYSTEAYCVLATEGVEPRYLATYARKLGVAPNEAVCDSFRPKLRARSKGWDFRDRRPYPDSAIRLSQAQIEAIRAARERFDKQ